MDIYSKKVMELFKNPKNIGEIKNADGIGKVGNPVCGDVMWMYLKIKKKSGKEIIKDVKVKTFGCVAAIATSSMLTEIIKGKTLKEAEKISKQNLAKAVGGLPKVKFHCSVLAVDALKKAIEDYRERKKKKKSKKKKMSKWIKRFKQSRNLVFTKEDFKKYSEQVKEEFNFFKKYFKKKKKVLECGCGLGCTAVPLSHYYDVTCVDIDKEVLKYAKINGKNFGKNMKFKLMDVANVDKNFKKDSFNACTHGGFIEHFPEKKIKTLLKKQLKVAPLIIFSMPIRTEHNLKAYKTRKVRNKEIHEDQIYRNLWTKEYWLNTILKDFNVVEYNEGNNNNSISGLDELMVVIKR